MIPQNTTPNILANHFLQAQRFRQQDNSPTPINPIILPHLSHSFNYLDHRQNFAYPFCSTKLRSFSPSFSPHAHFFPITHKISSANRNRNPPVPIGIKRDYFHSIFERPIKPMGLQLQPFRLAVHHTDPSQYPQLAFST